MKKIRTFQFRHLGSERGIALAMVLILSVISLAIMAGLVYMVTSGMQISGIQKRYKTSLEAGVGAAQMTYTIIGMQNKSDTDDLFKELTTAGLSPVLATPAECTGKTFSNQIFSGLEAKLKTSTGTWSEACKKSFTIDPAVSSSYDMKFDLGPSSNYTVYVKIVDTLEGNTGADLGLSKGGVVSDTGGEPPSMSRPAVYTLEIESQSKSNPSERAKLSVLFQN